MVGELEDKEEAEVGVAKQMPSNTTFNAPPCIAALQCRIPPIAPSHPVESMLAYRDIFPIKDCHLGTAFVTRSAPHARTPLDYRGLHCTTTLHLSAHRTSLPAAACVHA